ncbi:ABC transporter permease [Balneatrix alpica]|uniref:ABC transporter permease n=1 Tax=Balneatrix alpica TaxID=75684 RepID=A0ABV5ZBE0_9GAMM|nr:ABC transporter permease [Balneatrix alpica]
MDMELLVNVLYAAIRTGTPLLLVALGELVCEKSGVLNLGQEGMMLMGAVAGFIAAYQGLPLPMAFVVAMLAGMLMSWLFGFLALQLSTNQVATGLALTILGVGLSAFLGAAYIGQPVEGVRPWELPLLADIPLLGKVLFSHDPLVYLSFVLAAAVAWFLYRTRAGLMLRAIGESPQSANATGLPVLWVRYAAVSFGGAMAGLAGAYLSLVYTPMWAENMTAGRGWIALALVVFASWRVGRALLGAYLFGLASILHLVLQGMGFAVSPNLLAMLPYVATIVVLVLLSRGGGRHLNAPMSLGKPFHPARH